LRLQFQSAAELPIGHRSVAAEVTCSWQLSYDHGPFFFTPLQSSSVQFSPVSGYLKPNLGFGDESAAGGHVYQGSAYKIAAKLSPAQRDPQQGQFQSFLLAIELLVGRLFMWKSLAVW